MVRKTLSLMLFALLLCAGSGLCAPQTKAACPMGDCAGAPPGALQAPSCCCPPAGTAPAAPAGKPAVNETAGDAAAATAIRASLPSHLAGTDRGTVDPPRDLVPLYLLHASLLI